MSANDHTVECVHHWVLDAPHRGWVKGACKKCGLANRFEAEPAFKFGRPRRRPAA